MALVWFTCASHDSWVSSSCTCTHYARMQTHPLISIGRLQSVSVDGKLYAGAIQLPTRYIYRGTMSEYNAYKAVKIKRSWLYH